MNTRQQRRAAARRAGRAPGFDGGLAVQLADLAVPHVERLIAEGHAPEAITAAVSRIGNNLHITAAPIALARDAALRAGCPYALDVTAAEPVPGATWCLVFAPGATSLVLLMRDVITAPGGVA